MNSLRFWFWEIYYSLLFEKNYPDLIEIVHFDDYQKEEEEVPSFKGMKNWDHPDAIDFDSLYRDLIDLKNGIEVEIMTKSSVLNPNYEKNWRIKHILKPKKIIIVEWYMTLVDEKIREMFDFKIFLDIPIEESMKRRDKVTYNDESEYNNKILFPMHKKYVEPTKDFADLKIDVLENSKEQSYKTIYLELEKFL